VANAIHLRKLDFSFVTTFCVTIPFFKVTQNMIGLWT